MKIIGVVSRVMYHNQNPKFISYTDLQMYKIPVESMCGVDIGRLIYLDEQTGEVKLETYKKKTLREARSYVLEKEENRPIINDASNGRH